MYSIWLGPGLVRKQANEQEIIGDSDGNVDWEGILRLYISKDHYKSIQTKVFEKDLLEGTLIGNLLKIFVMPIYTELSNMHILP